MFYYLELILVAYIITLIGKLILSKKKHELSNIGALYYFGALFAFSGIAIRTYIYFVKSGNYFFMDLDVHRKIKVFCVAFIIDIFLFVIISMGDIVLKKRDKDSIFDIKGWKIFPIVSIKNCIATCVTIYSIFAIADSLMPQYGYWKIENININYSSTYIHDLIPQNDTELQYPLVSDLSNITEGDNVILVIGDSFIWGDGASNVNNLWWRKLQNKIIEEGYGSCKIVAVGRNGASTQDQLKWIRNTTMISDIAPDMVIFGYVTNDAEYIDENGNMIPSQWSPSSYITTSKIMRFASFIFPNIAMKIDNDLQARKIKTTDLSSDNMYYYDEWEYEIVNESNLQRYSKETLEPLSQTLDSLGIKYCFITTPSVPSYEKYNELYSIVIPKFEEAGIPIYNCLEDFVEKCADNSDCFMGINPVNGHPGVSTNAYIANYALDVLKNNYSDVLGKKSEYKEDGMRINDWYPGKKIAPKQYDGAIIEFSYSDSWSPDNYLYLPMFQKSIKMCFDQPINLSGKTITLYDENGNDANLVIRVTYLDKNGCEVMENTPIKAKSGEYKCNYSYVTSINISGSTGGQEHRYILRVFE